MADYFPIEWLGGVANVPLAPRPLKAFGKRWTATGQLASDVVARHLPTSATSEMGSYLDLEIRCLIYEDAELTRLWREVLGVPRELITRVIMRYYVISGYELGVRYERDYHDKNFEPSEEVRYYLIGADNDKVDDGLLYGYSVEFNKAHLPEDMRESEHEKLAQDFTFPLCGHFVNPVPGAAKNYHANFDMPDGEMTLTMTYRRDIAPNPRYYPALLTTTYIKEPAPEEIRCPLCRTIILPE